MRFWFRLGWISFGGTAGHIALMHDFLVDKKRWISNSRFLHALSLCMLLPGPEAQQLAIYIGQQLHGKKGGLIAGIFFVLPSMLILLLLSIIYVLYGNLPWIYGMFNGLKPCVIALIIIGAILLAVLIRRGNPSLLHGDKDRQDQDSTAEEGYFINNSRPGHRPLFLPSAALIPYYPMSPCLLIN
jgi:putative chromate ion transporter